VPPVAIDPAVPEWLLQIIMASPTACAVLAVGYLLRASIDKQAPVVAGAIKLLAEAIQGATVDMHDALAENRATSPGRRRGPKTGSMATLPRD
jgi:hypothetical protein